MQLDGDDRKARRAFLRAAALELEALAALEDPGESTTIGVLIEIVYLIKQATGYKSLPDVGDGKGKPIPQRLVDSMARRD